MFKNNLPHHESYIQGFGVPAKAHYCAMWGGDITNLAEDLGKALYSTPIGKGLTIYFNSVESMTIKGDRQPASLKDKAKRAIRNIRNMGKSDMDKKADFEMNVLIDEGGADLNLQGSDKWKEPLYKAVLETVQSQVA
jgi:hypothetical protein